MIDHLETQLELAIDLEVCSFLSLSLTFVFKLLLASFLSIISRPHLFNADILTYE